MRITDQTLMRRSVGAISSNLRSMAEAQNRVSTGLRFFRGSEDPSGASEVMRTSDSLRAVDQLSRNVDFARGRVETEENVLDQLTLALTRASELAVGQASATANAGTRMATKAEVDDLLRFAISLGNTRSSDGFLFGGDYVDQPPFDPGADLSLPVDRALYVSADPADPSVKREPTGEAKVLIGSGFELATAHNGAEIFLDTKALESLHALSTALGANDVDGIRSSIENLRGSIDSVQVRVGEIGARFKQLEITESSLKSLSVTLATYKSGIEEVEFEVAATDLASRQSAYQAALLATSRVLNLSITDYLR